MKDSSGQNRYVKSLHLDSKITSPGVQDYAPFNFDFQSNKENVNYKAFFVKNIQSESNYGQIKFQSDLSLKNERLSDLNRRNYSSILKTKLGNAADLEKICLKHLKKAYHEEHKMTNYQGKCSQSKKASIKQSKYENKRGGHSLKTTQSSIKEVPSSQSFTIRLQQLRCKKRKHKNQIMRFPVVNLYKEAKPTMPVYEISNENMNSILLKDYFSKIVNVESSSQEIKKPRQPEWYISKVSLTENKNLKKNVRRAYYNLEKPVEKRKIESVHKYLKQVALTKKQQNQSDIEVKPWSIGEIHLDQ